MTILNWGLIGAGDIARKRIAPALRDLPNCRLAAVARSRSALAASFAAEFGARRWYENWQDLIADAAIDAVYIATPVHLHAAQAVAAADSGKHILCEKPMALSAAECSRMISACKASGVKLGIAYYRRFYPVIGRIRQIIASGEIGRVALAQINAFEWFDPAADDPRRWLLEKEKSGGGPMMDFGCHRLEVLTNLFGEIGRLQSIASSALIEREVEDTALAQFQFENGICATLTVTHAAFEAQDTLDIFGTRGSIHVPVLNAGEMRITTGGGERVEFHPPAPNVHQPLIENFAEAVLNNETPAITGETGLKIALLEEEIYRQGK